MEVIWFELEHRLVSCELSWIKNFPDIIKLKFLSEYGFDKWQCKIDSNQIVVWELNDGVCNELTKDLHVQLLLWAFKELWVEEVF